MFFGGPFVRNAKGGGEEKLSSGREPASAGAQIKLSGGQSAAQKI